MENFLNKVKNRGKKCEPITKLVSESLREEFNEDLRIDEKGDIITGSINICVKTSDHNKVFFQVMHAVESAIVHHIGGEGEIIKLKVRNGEIYDMGQLEFLVIKGAVFEVYCFKCFCSAIIRVLLETDWEKKWISVDIDEYKKSPWF